MSRLRIALIGSRELEKNKKYEGDIKICYNVCLRLAQLKVQFTSGLCELGMDGVSQKAYSKALDLGWIDESYFEVYVAEQKNIDRSPLPNKHLVKVRNKDSIEKSEELASLLHIVQKLFRFKSALFEILEIRCISHAISYLFFSNSVTVIIMSPLILCINYSRCRLKVNVLVYCYRY